MRDFQFYPVDRVAMDRFLELCKRQHYPARATVMRPGDDGRELILSYLNPGDFIGEMGLFMRPAQREVLVRTKTKCELAEISYAQLRDALDGELKDYSLEIMTAIGAKLAQRLLQARRKVEHLAFLDTQGRVARTLIDLCGEPDAVSHPEGTQIRITRQEVSRIVGCSREMAGRVMKTLEEEGMIRASGKTIVVLGTYKGSAPT